MTPRAMSQVKNSLAVHTEAFLFSPVERWDGVGLPDIHGQGEGGLEGIQCTAYVTWQTFRNLIPQKGRPMKRPFHHAHEAALCV